MIFHIIIGLSVGGAEKVLLRLLSSVDSNDCIIVSLTSKGVIGDILEEKGFKVFFLELNKFNFLLVFFNLVKLLRLYQPRLVQTWLYHADLIGGLAAKFVGINHVIWGIRTTELRKGSYVTFCIRRLLAWLSYWVPTKVVVVAEKAKKKHIEIGYDASKMEVIPNGFDIEAFQVAPSDVSLFKKDIGISKSDFVIGCVGRLSQDKGQDVFIAAAELVLKQFPSIKFLMVGRDLELSNAQVTRWIAKTSYPDNFILVGERSDVAVCLKAMDIFCLPSRSEGFPNVLGEAMLAGVPCVSTDAGDAAVLGGMDVPIAEVDNSIDLANKLIGLLEKTVEERNELGRALNQRIVEKYSVDKMVSRYIDLYKELEGYKK